MRLILLGPPGAGKGTQATRLADRFAVPHVATGDLLRDAVRQETRIGVRAKTFMDAGELVPDDVVLDLLLERLTQADAAQGFILDGFPRNPAQAELLDGALAKVGHRIEAVVSVEVADEIIIGRLSSRATCPQCHKTFVLDNGLPATCSNDGTTLMARTDDKPEVITKRLEIFHEQTKPLVEHYEAKGLLVRIDGVGELDEVEERIAKALEAQ